MVDLAAIGRARPAQNVRNVIDVQNRRRQLDMRQKYVDSQVALNTEQLNKLRYEKAQHEKMSVLHPYETTIGGTFYGGPDGKVSQEVLKRMTRMGLVGQPVDHRHSGIVRQLGQMAVIGGAQHDDIDIARQHPRGVGNALAAAKLHVITIEHNGFTADIYLYFHP